MLSALRVAYHFPFAVSCSLLSCESVELLEDEDDVLLGVTCVYTHTHTRTLKHAYG